MNTLRSLLILTLSGLILSACTSNICPCTNPSENPNPSKIKLDWTLGWAESKNAIPKEFVNAKVPGSVQLDIAKAKNYPDYNYSTNPEMFRWMETMFYTYKTSFPKPYLKTNQRLFINSKGIDYEYEVFLNGKSIYAHEGMFKRFQIDITDFLKDGNNILEVKINPIPMAFPEKNLKYPEFRFNASKSAKPAVSYGWDWHPRLIPLGIWDDLDLEIRNKSNITYSYLSYKLSNDLKEASLQMQLEGNNIKNKTYFWELLDKDGKCVMSQSGQIKDNSICIPAGTFKNPKLWWTHDHGIPYLYTWKLTLADSDGKALHTISDKVGFRKIRLIMSEGSWEKPTSTLPLNLCNESPMQVELNGKPIFTKGTNWVNPEIFFSEIDAKRYQKLVDFAVNANFNIFRVWGGAIVNKDVFFELCNEKGILVWQEFPLACNEYPDEEKYLKVLEKEARDIVKRVRKNPCIAMWCGGNELFNLWSKMTPQSHPLRLLDSICFELNPEVPFNFTSPLIGIAHGHYKFKPNWRTNDDAMTLFKKADMVAYCEFGVNGSASVENIKKCIPKNELWPIKRTPSWETHHAFGEYGNGWLFFPTLEEYCGKLNSLEETVEASQFMQAQGYKSLFEDARRQKPHCAMVINWDYNEAWVVAAGNALIEYPAKPKPAYYAVKESCRPQMISGAWTSILWKSESEMDFELWLFNDKFEDLNSGNIKIYVKNAGKETLLKEVKSVTAKSNKNLKIDSLKVKLPKLEGKRFSIILRSDSNPNLDSEYGFIVKKDN